MDLGFERILQVKIPVTDLQRSVNWYRRVFGLRLAWEFGEDGRVTGAVLTDEAERFLIGLRLLDTVPGKPSLAGFDVVSLGVPSVDVLEALAERFDDLGVEHGPLFDRGPGGGVQLDVPDPDGTVIRILSPFGEHAPFNGVEFLADGSPTFYSTPRLQLD
ncbi:catechol 2,3-dioxygenase-like lactoylglutathione lyase family enzyme [Kribbella sp. VKM Ac-2527]|uniref:Catechol 2,3-dioxygenase-like lactoylglutathione lyase family enzyme n=1 Tax=Kribbella caucasensis TaxID=2512215 RepID=A0A4V6PSL5_9ACTN|nr:VOC family protein [Kribbella sp. VKM Ac-2527]TDO29628.1 catechol 2,3-dioxygenase-like lactoylglutathione lyase family enzyme [Kribbella sp. VKM Ac-2527]